MKKGKRIAAFMGALLMAAALTACGSQGTGGGGSTGGAQQDTPADESGTGQQDISGTEQTDAQQNEGDADAEPSTTSDNTLVAYFSYSGNTEAVAQQIAEYTGGTLVEIQRSTPYEDVNTEGEEELNSDARPEITVDLESIEEYDTIFIGYPIWWDEAPMVISTFLESYDFSGKTIAPFCTSASDPIDNSLHVFTELAPDAEIAEGLTANSDGDIISWLNSLGY